MASLKTTLKRVQFLAGFQPERYDCCINSCICFTGPYVDLTTCPTCNTDRLKPNGEPGSYFQCIPLIPRLRAMVANRSLALAMRYRAFDHQFNPPTITDVFDGSHYHTLLNTFVTVADQQLPFLFFNDPRDVALGLSTDGFGPFKHRQQTAWPLLIFNYNLPPEVRFNKKHVISLGVIPGPKKPGDIDSFLWPLVQELLQLMLGVQAYDALSRSVYLLRAYLILVFGDIPAVPVLYVHDSRGSSPPFSRYYPLRSTSSSQPPPGNISTWIRSASAAASNTRHLYSASWTSTTSRK